MFSERTNWKLAQNRLTEAIAQVRASGKTILNLTASNPTRIGLKYDAAAILGAFRSPKSLDYDPQAKGLLSAREAVSDYYRADHDVEVDPERIVLTTSTSEGYSFVLRLLCNAGDELLVPKPSYPLFEFLADLQDVKLVPYPLIYDHGWQMDFHSLERAATARTRGVVVVHPNNPTGSFVSEEEREQLNAFCRERGLAVVVDEVFLDYGMKDAAAFPGLAKAARPFDKLRAGSGASHSVEPLQNSGSLYATLDRHAAIQRLGRDDNALRDQDDNAFGSFAGNDEVLTFTLSGLSKIAALPQMKVAWVVTSGPEEIVREAMARLEVIADTYLSMNAPVQWAIPVMLEQRKDIQRQLMARVRANLSELDRQLSGQKACERLEVEGGWYAVLRVPVTRSDEELAIELVRERQVLVHPGHFYDFPSDGYLVVSLIGEEGEFASGVQRVLRDLNQVLD
jgi:alanine-synthesizing transaminase